MSLDNVVKINITRSAAPVTREGFGTALILGTAASGWDTDRVRTYFEPDELLDDGFTDSDVEYKFAVALFAQPVKPTQFKVGRRLTPVAQVTTLTPDVTDQSVQVFSVTINDTLFAFTSDISPTATEVVTGLIALINAGVEPVTASGTTTLILTADDEGISFTAIPSDNLTAVATTANVGIKSDLADINAIDSDWYALLETSGTVDNILEAASWIESVRKVFAAQSNDTSIVGSGTADIMSMLKAKSYFRTFLIYSADTASGPAGAELGNVLPLQPGSYTLKFKNLSGITPDALSGTQYNYAKGKNANIYTVVAGSGMVEEGVVAGGEFLDNIIGIDWIDVNMQADIFQILKDNAKIPYTNKGTNTIVNAVDNRLRLATVAGILSEDEPYTVTAPLVSQQDPANRAARKIAGIKFNAKLANAVHAVEIDGYVSV